MVTPPEIAFYTTVKKVLTFTRVPEFSSGEFRMKRKHSFISTLSSLMVAIFMIAAYSTVAEAHRSSSGASITFGFSSGGSVSRGHPDRYRRYPRRSYDRRYYNRGHSHVITQPRYIYPQRHSHSRRASAHVNWCINRYRSYDVYTDTFQPYHGPRRRCNSPY